MYCFFFFKQKTAYDMRISDWSSDVCSSDLHAADSRGQRFLRVTPQLRLGLVPAGTRDQLLSIEPNLRRDFRHDRGVLEVPLLAPRRSREREDRTSVV